jgi:quercetin dioxygenase-like cupin family protein
MKHLILIVLIVFAGCKNANIQTNQSQYNYPKMNLKDLHKEDKAVQTKLLFQAEEGKVVSLQIAAKEQLKEHLSKVPATLICVSGKAIYKQASAFVILEAGDYVMIPKDVIHEVNAITDSNFVLIK